MRNLLFLLAAIAIAQNDPHYQAKGDQKRTYLFPETGESMPYHVYVPSKWNKNMQMPLIVVLHGNGATPDVPFERADGILSKLAEQKGYIVVAPMGYRPNGGYNNSLRRAPNPRLAGAGARGAGGPPAGQTAPLTAEDRKRSEEDVLNVTEMVAKEYNVDRSRIYLMGNSMGGAGTWYLGQKYPERWAALAPSAGPLAAEDYPWDRLKGLAVLTIHGDNDDVAPVEGTRAMAAQAKKVGADVTYIEVKGGDHFGAWASVAPQIFEFFGKHRKKR